MIELVDSIVTSLTANADAIWQALAETGYMLVFSWSPPLCSGCHSAC